MRTLCALLVILCLAAAARAATVWIDIDVSIGSPFREVDEAFALVLAFHSPEIHIAGSGHHPGGKTGVAHHREVVCQDGSVWATDGDAAPNEWRAARSLLHGVRAGREAFHYAKNYDAAKPRITRKGDFQIALGGLETVAP